MRKYRNQNRTIRILLAMFVIAGFCGCKSLEKDLFQPDYRNASLLPKLTCWIDQPSFENAYGASSYSVKVSDDLKTPYGLTETPYGKGVYEITAKTKLYTAEKRIQDASDVFVTEVSDNICDMTTRKKGNIIIRAGDIYNKNNYKWSWLSGFTFGVLNVFGMPLCANETELEVIVEIYDTRNNLVAKFNERGYSKQYMAFYHGYYEFQRRAATLALQDGLMKIKELIEKDASTIKMKLK